MMRRSAHHLPRELNRLFYIAVVRTHLEYASSLLIPVAKSHLEKLDIVQRKAARIICQVPSDTHAAPLLEDLSLQPLHTRRVQHLLNIVTACIEKNSQPDLVKKFCKSNVTDNLLSVPTARSLLGKKRFSYLGAIEYNKSITNDIAPSQPYEIGSAVSRHASQNMIATNALPFSASSTANLQLNTTSSIKELT